MSGEIKLASKEQIMARQTARIIELENKLARIHDANLILRLAKEMRLTVASRIAAGIFAGGALNTGSYAQLVKNSVQCADMLIAELSKEHDDSGTSKR